MSYASANAWTTAGQGAGNLGRAILEIATRTEERKRQREMDARASELHDVNLGLTKARAAEQGYFFGDAPHESQLFTPAQLAELDAPDPANPNGFARPELSAGGPTPTPSVGQSIMKLALSPTSPPPARYTQVAPNLYRDSTQTPEARERAEKERVHTEAKARFLGLGYDDAKADALAWGQVNGVDFRYSPLTRDEQFTDLRETGEIGDTFAARSQGRQHRYNLGAISASGEQSRRTAEFTNNLPLGPADLAKIDAYGRGGTGGSTGTRGTPTELERKAAMVYPRAADAARIIDDYTEKHGAPPPQSWMGRIRGGNYGLTEEQQQLQQAGEVLATAILRMESGAAVTQSEAQSYAKQFIPQPGDTPAVLEQKRRARVQAVEGLRRAQGRATPEDSSPPARSYSADNPFAPR